MKVNYINNDKNINKNTFTVSGKVTNLALEPLPKQEVILVDIDLLSAAVYKTITKVSDFKKTKIEVLGKTNTNANGAYIISFERKDFASQERGLPDVVAFVVYEDAIVGRSRLSTKNDWLSENVLQKLNVKLENTNFKNLTEYTIVMQAIMPLVKGAKLDLYQLHGSTDQTQFLAQEAEQDLIHVSLLVEAAKRVTEYPNDSLSHELFYGIGRQNIALNWLVLYKKSDKELRTAIIKSVKEKIIKDYDEKLINTFLLLLHKLAVAYTLKYKSNNQTASLEILLSAALPEKVQQQAFVNAYRNFKSQIAANEIIDYKKFWREYLPAVKEFKGKPELITSLLFTQQLSIISGNHQPLMEALQVTGKLSSVNQLIALGDNEWKEIIKKSGVPEFIKGENEGERIAAYANQMQTFLNAAYPTQKIALMLKNKELPIENVNVSEKITDFIRQNPKFDIGTTPIHEYVDEIKSIAKEHYPEVKKELNRMQRVFQVSPKPEVMGILMEKNLNSAYTISSIPKKSFIKMYGEALGSNLMTETVYQRAEHVSTLAAERAIKMYDLSHLAAPAFAYSKSDREEVLAILQNQVSKRHNPNYSEIFGNPDMCECDHCRSLFSPAAYFVDLLRFLWRGDKNDDRTPVVIDGITVRFPDGKSPLDKFSERRPDLLHLPLTCENTNTIIPYIDLVNEVMEYYTYHNALSSGAVYNTGSTTADELRANPQNFDLRAYHVLKNAVYPFSLPYHQPLDVIRTYSDHLRIERYEVMIAMQKKLPSEPEIVTATKAIEAEALRVSEEEYVILTKKKFDASSDTKQLQQYFGFPFSSSPNPELDPIVLTNLEKVAGTGVTDGIHEFLRRSGLKYTELVDLIKTKFINPHQGILEYLEGLFVNSTMGASAIYIKLQEIKEGTPDSTFIATLPVEVQPTFVAFIQEHFDNFKSVITLYQANSICNLDTTYLRTVANIYAGTATSGIPTDTWSKIHRFIRLWRKLRWTMHEVDLMLAALGESDITDACITKLSYVALLNKQLKLPINKLATLWGSIDTHGDKSLYKTLFLNKAVQRIDQVFEADAFGDYLKGSAILQDHIPATLASFRISEDDLIAILGVAKVTTRIVSEVPAVELTIPNLSAIYRFVILSKALKLKVPECCLLAKLFNTTSSTIADFVFENPTSTFNFYELAASVKKSGFKSELLQYIFNGTLPAASTLNLSNDKLAQATIDIKKAFEEIAQRYPTPGSLSPEILSNLLLLKQKLHEDVIIQHIALLTDLSETVTQELIKEEVGTIIGSVESEGFTIDETAKKYHRAAKFISGLILTDKEVKHFISYKSDFDNIDFKSITPLHWKRINDYVQLRNAVPQSQALLIDVFAAANIVPAPSIDMLTNQLHLATAWDLNTISYLVNSHFILPTDKFKNEIEFLKIYAAVSLVIKTGLSAETLAKWADTVTDFDSLNDTADLVRRAVKAKYEVEDWLKLAGNLSDKIRENQKQALISHLLTKEEIIEQRITDADGLFEYFLIDVQMGACMDTSRIVQANAAVQLFVTRCLLNLESDRSTGAEKGVAPDAIDKDRWAWMKNYRVWEVNRKIFLYPENWLEPNGVMTAAHSLKS
ncbi:MAG: hypothetical protein IPL22_00135 [Bacteroidetes bacterium]|nr:hypothetical protein [Bacteroidota bacterium]